MTMLNFLANAKEGDQITFDFGLGDFDTAMDFTVGEGAVVLARITCVNGTDDSRRYKLTITTTKNRISIEERVEIPDQNVEMDQGMLWHWFLRIVRKTDFIGYGIPKK